MTSLIQLGKFSLLNPLLPTKTLTKPRASIPHPLCKCNAMSDSNDLASQNASPNLENYPKPLSPPLPPISKAMELSRAMTSSSKSGLFVISRADFIHEDEWLVAVNKPQGIYCEAVLESVRKALSDSGSEPEVHLANRLDRDTSGVMVVTKSHKVAAKLVKAFTARQVSKTYVASCSGPAAPEWDRITVNSGHGRSKFGAWRVYAASDVGKSLPGGSSVRDMETTFEVISVNGVARPRGVLGGEVIVVEESSKFGRRKGEEEEVVMVRARPRSGRTHQIRLHCQYLGISIRGDVKYGGAPHFEGHQLHAETMSLLHPVTGVSLLLSAPLPCWASHPDPS